jgi:hypothetical protein
MTKLAAQQVLRREITIDGIDAPVVVNITSSGITMHAKGGRKLVSATWKSILSKAMVTPSDVPSWLMFKPYELLQHQATKAAAVRNAKR